MKKVTAILAVATALMICSCANKQEAAYNASAYTEMAMKVEDESLQIDEREVDKVETIERKIIKEGEIKFKTTDVNKTKSLIEQTVQKLNGYIANDNAYDYSDRFEHRLTIRVPADKFDLLLTNISENVEKLDYKNIDVRDVTEEYIDMEARIKTKKELQNRYKEILKQATRVDEMLNIERQIGNLQTEIESVEGRMKYLKDRIAFSTLTVTYYQETTSSTGFFSKIAEALGNGWSVFLWFLIGLSYLWVFILIAVAIIYLIVRRRRRRRQLNNKK